MSAQLSLSTVDTTKTTKSTSSKTAAARKGPRVLAQPSVVQLAAAQWATMTGDEKNTYAAATGQMADALEPTLPARQSAYATFVALSAANIAAGQPLQTTASPYTSAPPLPAMQLIATSVGGKFTLTLISNSGYAYPIAVKAAKPVLAASNVYKSTAFKKIGSIPDFGGTVNITDLYQSRYRVPGTGYKIALELTGVAPGGYHTAGVYVFGVVGNTAAAGAEFDGEEAPVVLKVG